MTATVFRWMSYTFEHLQLQRACSQRTCKLLMTSSLPTKPGQPQREGVFGSQPLQPLISVIKLPQRLFIDLQALGIGQNTGMPASQ
jgi:hypothetical protein